MCAKDDYIAKLEKENAELKKRLEQLERIVNQNSNNSSKPPSSDFGRNARTTKPKKKTKRTRKKGAQKGHKPCLRQLLPPESVTNTIHLIPDCCTCGCTDLQASDETPLRFQTVDIPPIKPKVTEYIQHMRECLQCGEVVYEILPDTIKRNVFGPGVLAVVGILTGMLNTSKRKALEMMNEVFAVPMSLGGLSNCEAKIAAAMASPYHDVVDYVQSQERAHADESGWPRGNRLKGWMWAMCCKTAAIFMIHANRSQEAARKLLGSFSGILNSDRWNGYNMYNHIRQICWAHLKRDFKSISEAKGQLGCIGKELCKLRKTIFVLYHRARDGTIQWRTFQRRMEQHAEEVERLLAEGSTHEGPLAGKCREILKHRHHLWTFVRDQQVEPTNNAAERVIRQAVIWRKMSFGTQSKRGSCYVERMLTVCSTYRLQAAVSLPTCARSATVT
jgi:transposase